MKIFVKKIRVAVTLLILVNLIVPQAAFSFTTDKLSDELKVLKENNLQETRISIDGVEKVFLDREINLSNSASYQKADVISDQNYVPGEIIVKFKNDSSTFKQSFSNNKANSLAVRNNLIVKDILTRSNIAVMKISKDENINEVISKLKNDPTVEYAEPNYKRYKAVINTNDPSRNQLWGLDNTGQLVDGTTGTVDADIDLPEAWAQSEGTNDVIVAVIDDGVAYNHPDLSSAMWNGSLCKDENGNNLGGCNHGYDFENNDKTPLPDGTHGTHVAGTIAASKDNNVGILGVSPNAKIMALRFAFDIASEIKAIDFAIANGAKVINASYVSPDFSQAEYDAINRFKASGGIFVAAAGNEGISNDAVHSYPSDHTLDNIISVAATTQHDSLASFSNFGSTSVDVAAPGVSILSTVPTAQISTFLNEEFEGVLAPNVPSGWTAGGYWGTYNMSYGNVLYGDFSNYPYANNNESSILSAEYNLGSAAAADFSFWTRCDTEYYSYDDRMELYFSNDGFNTYDYMGFWNEYSMDDDSDPNTASLDLLSVSIPEKYLTNNFQFAFVWITDASDSGTTGDGCWIDSIQIQKAVYDNGSGNSYDYYPGTSMAAPHVAGLASLLWSIKSDLDYGQVRNIIFDTGDSLVGGLIATNKRINANNAVQAVLDLDIVTELTINTLQDPVAQNVLAGDVEYLYSTILFDNASSSEDVIVTELEYSISPINGAKTNEIQNVFFKTTEGVQLTVPSNGTQDIPDLAEELVSSILGGGLVVPEGGSITVRVYADISQAALDGGAHKIDITSINNNEVTATGVVSDSVANTIEGDSVANYMTVLPSIPILTEVTPIVTPANDTTPDYTFSSNMEATITYSGSCSSVTIEATVGDNTITFDELTEGTYSDCSLTARSVNAVTGDPLIITEFTIDTTAPILAEVTPVATLANDTTPDYTFSSDEAGTINYSGSCSSVITAATVGDNTITFDELTEGTYSDCSLTVTDASNNTSSILGIAEFTIDIIAPVIILTGEAIVEVIVDTTYVDDGATATDNVDVSITVDVVNPVDTAVIDTYTITYNATDEAGNAADEVTRTVNVVEAPDETAPVLTEVTPVATLANDTTPDYTFSLDEAGTINYLGSCSGATTVAEVGSNTITFDALAEGTYSDCALTVTDASNNVSDSLAINEFTIDITVPVITLTGEANVEIIIGNDYTELGATATDNVDADFAATVSGVVNTNVIDTYTVTYSATDEAGNVATSIERIVNVVEAPDETAPVITLNGDSEITIYVGEDFVDPLYIAIDDISGDITGSVVVGGDTVDTNTPGTYVITYNVSDNSGNAADEVTRLVNVELDAVNPLIVLIGESEMTLNVFETFTDPGYSAEDNIDGDITSSVVVGGDTVDTNTPGIYVITYNVSDSSNNAADEVTRTVGIVDLGYPVINLTGELVIELLVGEEYIEPGYEALDNVDGDITSSVVIGGDVLTTSTPAGIYTITYDVTDSSSNDADQKTRTVIVYDSIDGGSLEDLFISGTLSLPDGATSTSTSQIIVNQPLSINAGGSTIVLPQGTIITTVSGEDFDSSLLGAVSGGDVSGLGENTVVDGVLQWGIVDLGLEFSEPITLNIFVGIDKNGETLTITRSTNGSSEWTSDGIIDPATCVVTDGYCQFSATKASYYTVLHTVTPPSSGGGGGGGGGGYTPTPTPEPVLQEVLGVKVVGAQLIAKEGVEGAAVYYVSEDGKKYIFPDSKTYFTWYDNFDDVVRVGMDVLDSYPDGGVMPYRAGTKLITHSDTAKIYAVEPNGLLRYIPSAEVAEALYGDNWTTLVQDVIPGFFSVSYNLGEELADVLPTGTFVQEGSDYYYIDNGTKRKFETTDVVEENGFNYKFVLKVKDLSSYVLGELISIIEEF